MYAAKVKVGALAAAMLLGAGVWAHQALSVPPAPEESPPAAPAADAQAASEKPQVRLDVYGDPLPEGAISRMGTTRFREYGSIWTVAYSDGGTKIVSTSLGPIVSVWDAATGQQLQCFHGFTDWFLRFAVAPDHKTVACVSKERAIELWDLATQKKLRFWNTPNAQAPQEHQRQTHHLQFSPSGRLLAARGGDGSVRLWNTASGQLVREWLVDASGWSLPVTPDDRLIALAGPDKKLHVFETKTGEEVWTTEIAEWLRTATFSLDSKTLVGLIKKDAKPAAHAVYFWDAATGRELRRLDAEGDPGHLALSPDGRVVAVADSGSWETTIRLWDVAAGKELHQLKTPYSGHCAFSADGTKLVTGGFRIQQWDVATGRELNPQRGHAASIGAVALSLDGRLAVTTDQRGDLILWDAFTGNALHRQEWEWGDRRLFASLAFSSDGRQLLTSSTHPGVSVWDTATRREVSRITLGERREVQKMAVSPDGKLLALYVLTDRQHPELGLWELATGVPVRSLEAGEGRGFLGVTFSADGRTVFAMRTAAPFGEHEVYTWDVASGQGTPRFTVGAYSNADGPAAAVFSPDGRWFVRTYFDPTVSRNEQVLRMWDMATGREIRSLSRPQRVLSSPVFRPDSRVLAAQAHEGDVILWEVATGRELRSFSGHRGGSSGQASVLAFSGDGTLLASGSGDTNVYLWDVGGRLDPITGPLSAKELETHWAALVGDDAVRAEQAIKALAASPKESLPLLAGRLRPAAAADPTMVERLVAGLDSERFAAREQAAADLEKLGEPILPALREALAAKPTAEARRRLETVREKMEKTALTPVGERLREARALEVLERVGSPAARTILAGLTRGLPEATLTRDAKAVLGRLERRAAMSP